MGEVYRARDPRLGREVAIKVLHPSLSQNAKRLARFEQEARSASTLNHPNVLAIYDVGHDQGIPFLVTELLEGETLRERIESGSLTRRKAVEYAAQIADGLAAAHGKEHRPPRSQAGQRVHHPRRSPQDPRLRARQADPMGSRLSPVSSQSPTEGLDRSQRRSRHPRLHGAGATPRRACGPPLRHLRLRGDPVRDDLGAAALRRRHHQPRSAPPSCGTIRHPSPMSIAPCHRPSIGWYASASRRVPTRGSSRRTTWPTCCGRCRTPARPRRALPDEGQRSGRG